MGEEFWAFRVETLRGHLLVETARKTVQFNFHWCGVHHSRWCISALLDQADPSVHRTHQLLPLYSGRIDSIHPPASSDDLCYKHNQIPFSTPMSIHLHFILDFSRFNDYAFIFISLYHCLPPKCKNSLYKCLCSFLNDYPVFVPFPLACLQTDPHKAPQSLPYSSLTLVLFALALGNSHFFS